MSYELYFVDDEGGTITEFHGVLTDEVLLKATTERYASQERTSGFRYILNDFADCTTIEVSSATVRRVAGMALRVAEKNRRVVIAAVLPTDLMYGLGRMWQAYADQTGWTSNILRTRNDAEIWLRETLGQQLNFNHGQPPVRSQNSCG